MFWCYVIYFRVNPSLISTVMYMYFFSGNNFTLKLFHIGVLPISENHVCNLRLMLNDTNIFENRDNLRLSGKPSYALLWCYSMYLYHANSATFCTPITCEPSSLLHVQHFKLPNRTQISCFHFLISTTKVWQLMLKIPTTTAHFSYTVPTILRRRKSFLTP